MIALCHRSGILRSIVGSYDTLVDNSITTLLLYKYLLETLIRVALWTSLCQVAYQNILGQYYEYKEN